MNAAAYRPLIVEYRNGMPVRLEQLGNVVDRVEDDKQIAWYNGSRAIILAVSRQPGTNTVEVVDNVRKVLPELQASLPPAVKFESCSTLQNPFAIRFATSSSRCS